jgi:hypothetical protein
LSKENTKESVVEQLYRLDDLANNNTKNILYQRREFQYQNKKYTNSQEAE